jgi:hypothetical protein
MHEPSCEQALDPLLSCCSHKMRSPGALPDALKDRDFIVPGRQTNLVLLISGGNSAQLRYQVTDERVRRNFEIEARSWPSTCHRLR